MTMRGSCLCGAVSFEADPAERHSDACHCEMCRRWTGGPFISVPVAREALRWEGAEAIEVYRSSDWAERAFCRRCGSTLYYHATIEGPHERMFSLALGLFDEPDALPLASEIYIDSKPAAYAFAGERKRMTKAEVESMFTGGGS
jgi:hypothetical protein